MKDQCFLVQDHSRECRKMGRKCLERMTLKCRDVWNMIQCMSRTRQQQQNSN